MYSRIEGEEIDEVVTSPARPRLRDINSESTKLTGEKKEGFI